MIIRVTINKKVTALRIQSGWIEVITSKIYGRHPDLVNYWVYVTNDNGCVPFVVITIPSFLHSCSCFFMRITRLMSIVEQKPPTRPGNMSVFPCSTIFSFLCIVFYIIVCIFVLLLSFIALPIHLRFTASGCLFWYIHVFLIPELLSVHSIRYLRFNYWHR